MVAQGHRAKVRPGAGPLLLILLAVLLTAPGCGSGQDRPHVLLVVLDTTRADILSSYGCEMPTTPVLDDLAATGVRYDRAFSTAPWTLPSHASLFTGLYPHEAQATSETLHLPTYVTTIAERMRDAGYRTRAAVANPWVAPKRGFHRGFEEFVETWREPLNRPPTEEPLDWIREAKESGEPFFGFLNFNTPHLPYNPRPELRKEFLSPGRPTADVRRLMRLSSTYAYFVGEKKLGAEDYAILRELYGAEVHAVDTMLGRILGTLRETELLDDTLIIIVGDHGENIGDHGLLGHTFSMHESLLRIPLIVRYPKRFPSGKVETDLVSIVDILPTILDVCGVGGTEAAAHVRRRSLASADRERREFVVGENGRPVTALEQIEKFYPLFETRELDHRVKTIRTDRWKLRWRVGRGTELFDLEADPGETTDLAERQPDVARELLQTLRDWAEAHPAIRPTGSVEIDDEEARERMRALGYIK